MMKYLPSAAALLLLLVGCDSAEPGKETTLGLVYPPHDTVMIGDERSADVEFRWESSEPKSALLVSDEGSFVAADTHWTTGRSMSLKLEEGRYFWKVVAEDAETNARIVNAAASFPYRAFMNMFYAPDTVEAGRWYMVSSTSVRGYPPTTAEREGYTTDDFYSLTVTGAGADYHTFGLDILDSVHVLVQVEREEPRLIGRYIAPSGDAVRGAIDSLSATGVWIHAGFSFTKKPTTEVGPGQLSVSISGRKAYVRR